MSAVLAPRLSADRGYIGGGNIAGILGVSPYKSPLDEYLTITGQGEPEDDSRARFFKRRKALEPFAAEVFEQETGLKMVATNRRYHDDELPFVRAEIDFETSDGCNGETKTVHPLAAGEWGPSGSDEIPLYVAAQVMHGLGVRRDVEATWVHALVGLDDDRIYRIERDDELIATIRKHEAEFWNRHVLPLVPPDAMTPGDLRRLYPTDAGTIVEADAEMLEAINRLRDIKNQLKPLEDEFDAVKHQVQLYMRGAAVLHLEGKPLATWKAQSAQVFNQSAFAAAHPELFQQFKAARETRVFRLK